MASMNGTLSNRICCGVTPGRRLFLLKNLNHFKVIIVGLILTFVAVSVTGVFIYSRVMRDSGLEVEAASEYSHYYVVLTDNSQTSFWQSVYTSMKDAAQQQDAYVEILGENLSVNYSLEDKLQIAIDSEVDGIVLEPNGDTEIVALIEEATTQGIPVITVVSDEVLSQRKSFVGINNYDLGQEYGAQVVSALKEDTKEIVVLVNGQAEGSSDYSCYSQIKEMTAQIPGGEDITVSAVVIDPDSSFDAENTIREYFVNADEDPDLVVCLNSVNTECVYQAVVDFNLVGKVQIIGYHFSDRILEAVRMGNIFSTLALDAEQMGQYSIDALTEYNEMGLVSDFFSVDLAVIDHSSVDAFIVNQDQEQEQEAS